MTYLEFMKSKENEALENNKEDSAVVLLLEHICNLETNALFMKRGEEIEEEYVNKFNEIFDKYLHENKPIQYLIGTSCFYGYDFIVNENVLIPRFETEELVENILYKYDEHFGGKKVEVCDLATGSGCIAITLAKEEPNMHVVATDISKEALEVAKLNNQKFDANVKFLQGDMLTPLKGKKFDIFVSNPPYIPENEDVDSLVKDNEPNLALFGGDDGMKFYRIILQGLRPLLNKKALVAFEHGYDKKEEMLALCKKYFPECKAECIKDLEGKDRMTFIYVGDFTWQEE
ncbi:MAG: peptide chain release factor N(5)-glutamine methyltransferase [Anaeroplasma sp.]|uniref:peptide chain release factor N(5)-glutamine methyltransferase n=1 Tax=Anaeroplasma sp. TaxID=1872523 RepID=UPI002A9206BE|nr:peptide chain release factor N(5)-glutamine methyltransferase [Anaeroplasma sp.]MDY5983493.1 peptide chain release factor N(5)-glutamine methyltransferase [Anaeroplasma sp.]